MLTLSISLAMLSLGMSIGYLLSSWGQYKREKLAIRRGHIMIGDQQIFMLTPITLMDALAIDQMTKYSNNLETYMKGE